MLRISYDCLSFEGCERHRIIVSPFQFSSNAMRDQCSLWPIMSKSDAACPFQNSDPVNSL